MYHSAKNKVPADSAKNKVPALFHQGAFPWRAAGPPGRHGWRESVRKVENKRGGASGGEANAKIADGRFPKDFDGRRVKKVCNSRLHRGTFQGGLQFVVYVREEDIFKALSSGLRSSPTT